MEDELLLAVERAVRAPSSHNTQPWLFRLRDRAIELHADRTRLLPVVDPDGRELVMSCGAALLNLELALRHRGHAVKVELLPEPGDPDFLARTEVVGRLEPADAEEELFAAIDRRRTNRRPYSQEPVRPDLARILEEAARDEGARLTLIREELREQVADLVAEGDRRQLADRGFRRELAGWCRPNRPSRGDGIPGYALGFGDLGSRLAPVALRLFDLGRSQAPKSRALAVDAPFLALLSTDADGEGDRLHAGRALQRVLLRATAAGLSAAFLNQPVEVPELRASLGRLTGEAAPMLLLRIGRGPEARATPRRPVADVILE